MEFAAPRATLPAGEAVAACEPFERNIPCVAITLQLRARSIVGGQAEDSPRASAASRPCSIDLSEVDGVLDDLASSPAGYFVCKLHKLLRRQEAPASGGRRGDSPSAGLSAPGQPLEGAGEEEAAAAPATTFGCRVFGTLLDVSDFLWRVGELYLVIQPLRARRTRHRPFSSANPKSPCDADPAQDAQTEAEEEAEEAEDDEPRYVTFSLKEVLDGPTLGTRVGPGGPGGGKVREFFNQVQLDPGDDGTLLWVRLGLEEFAVPYGVGRDDPALPLREAGDAFVLSLSIVENRSMRALLGDSPPSRKSLQNGEEGGSPAPQVSLRLGHVRRACPPLAFASPADCERPAAADAALLPPSRFGLVLVGSWEEALLYLKGDLASAWVQLEEAPDRRDELDGSRSRAQQPARLRATHARPVELPIDLTPLATRVSQHLAMLHDSAFPPGVAPPPSLRATNSLSVLLHSANHARLPRRVSLQAQLLFLAFQAHSAGVPTDAGGAAARLSPSAPRAPQPPQPTALLASSPLHSERAGHHPPPLSTAEATFRPAPSSPGGAAPQSNSPEAWRSHCGALDAADALAPRAAPCAAPTQVALLEPAQPWRVLDAASKTAPAASPRGVEGDRAERATEAEARRKHADGLARSSAPFPSAPASSTSHAQDGAAMPPSRVGPDTGLPVSSLPLSSSALSHSLQPLAHSLQNGLAATQTHAAAMWRLSVDLVSLQLRGRPPASQRAVYVHYSYAPFGPRHSFSTEPAVDCSSGEAVPLPKGFCAYTLTASPARLLQSLRLTPLELIVYHQAARASSPAAGAPPGAQRLGTAVADLALLVQKPLRRHRQAPHEYQAYSAVLPVRGDAPDAETIGHLHIQLYLEHLQPPASIEARASTLFSAEESAGRVCCVFLICGSGEEKMSFTVAYELELWKQAEEAKFVAELKRREVQERERLLEQVRRVEQHKNQDLRARQEALQQLQLQLKQMAQQLQQKALELQSRENDLRSERERCMQAAARASEEATDATRRLREERNHAVHLEKQTSLMLQRQNEELQTEASRLRSRLECLEEENSELRQRVTSGPTAQLQSELKLKSYQVADLESRLAAMTASRDYFVSSCAALLDKLHAVKEIPPVPPPLWEREVESRMTSLRSEISSLRLALMENQRQVHAREDAPRASSPPSAAGRPSSSSASASAGQLLGGGAVSAPLVLPPTLPSAAFPADANDAAAGARRRGSGGKTPRSSPRCRETPAAAASLPDSRRFPTRGR
ncbi:hypothetical protein BESB_068490 [Besnoitia besnoiti]|uniref:DUF3668 domain-containing protein n=1 Tax=Besnoitia besnoiti TaxID=94643 RepID=A0A2A9MFR1_BESBE|nr:hypothetical protein BESB_068490 [Besnoitia besnoiti]PFH34816.1 hypothetical protein BESB_068490 [Besnoitia besnoiti]